MQAANLFMRLKGPAGFIKGDCQYVNEAYGNQGDFDFRGWIELSGWEWTVDTKGDKVKPSQVTVRKAADRASLPMMGVLSESKLCESAEIFLFEDSVDSDLGMYVWMDNARILDFSMSMESGEHTGSISETWVLGYDAISFGYTSYGSLSSNGKEATDVELKADPQDRLNGIQSRKLEDKVLELVRDRDPDTLSAFFKRIEESVRSQRKLTKQPPGDKASARDR